MKIEIKKDRKEPKLKIKNFTIFSYLLVILIFFVLGIWSERYDARLFLQKSLKEFLEFSSTKIFSNFHC